MEVPASAGTAKSPYLEVFFRVLSLLRVMFLKTHMSEGARYALRSHTVVMIQYSEVQDASKQNRGQVKPKLKVL